MLSADDFLCLCVRQICEVSLPFGTEQDTAHAQDYICRTGTVMLCYDMHRLQYVQDQKQTRSRPEADSENKPPCDVAVGL